MTRLEIAAIAQVLTMREWKDDQGNGVVLKDFIQCQKDLIKKIVDSEYQHRGESSSERSSKASRVVDALV